MQFCNQCGAQMNDGAKFCPKCGAVSAQPQAPQYSQPNNGESFNAPGFNPAPNNNYQQTTQVPPQQQVYGQNTQIPPYQAPKTGNFFKDILNTPDYTAQYDPADIQSVKGVTVACYFWILFWLPLATNSNSRYGRFHANQALLLLIASVGLSIVNAIFQAIFSAVFVEHYTYYFIEYTRLNAFGTILSILFNIILEIPPLVVLVLGVVNAVNCRAKELPIIGRFRLIK